MNPVTAGINQCIPLLGRLPNASNQVLATLVLRVNIFGVHLFKLKSDSGLRNDLHSKFPAITTMIAKLISDLIEFIKRFESMSLYLELKTKGHENFVRELVELTKRIMVLSTQLNKTQKCFTFAYHEPKYRRAEDLRSFCGAYIASIRDYLKVSIEPMRQSLESKTSMNVLLSDIALVDSAAGSFIAALGHDSKLTSLESNEINEIIKESGIIDCIVKMLNPPSKDSVVVSGLANQQAPAVSTNRASSTARQRAARKVELSTLSFDDVQFLFANLGYPDCCKALSTKPVDGKVLMTLGNEKGVRDCKLPIALAEMAAFAEKMQEFAAFGVSPELLAYHPAASPVAPVSLNVNFVSSQPIVGSRFENEPNSVPRSQSRSSRDRVENLRENEVNRTRSQSRGRDKIDSKLGDVISASASNNGTRSQSQGLRDEAEHSVDNERLGSSSTANRMPFTAQPSEAYTSVTVTTSYESNSTVSLRSLAVDDVLNLFLNLNLRNCDIVILQYAISGKDLANIRSEEEFEMMQFNLSPMSKRKAYRKIKDFAANGVPQTLLAKSPYNSSGSMFDPLITAVEDVPSRAVVIEQPVVVNAALATDFVSLKMIDVTQMCSIFMHIHCTGCVEVVLSKQLDGETFALIEHMDELTGLGFDLSAVQYKKVFRKIQEFIKDGVPKHMLSDPPRLAVSAANAQRLSAETSLVHTVASEALNINNSVTCDPAIIVEPNSLLDGFSIAQTRSFQVNNHSSQFALTDRVRSVSTSDVQELPTLIGAVGNLEPVCHNLKGQDSTVPIRLAEHSQQIESSIEVSPLPMPASTIAPAAIASSEVEAAIISDDHINLVDVTVKDVATIFRNINCASCVEIILSKQLDGETFSLMESPEDLDDLGFNLVGLQSKKLFRKLQLFINTGVPKYLLKPNAEDGQGDLPLSSKAAVSDGGQAASTCASALVINDGDNNSTYSRMSFGSTSSRKAFLSDMTVRDMKSIFISLNCASCVDVIEVNQLAGDFFAAINNESALSSIGFELTEFQNKKVFQKLQEFLRIGVPKYMLNNPMLLSTSKTPGPASHTISSPVVSLDNYDFENRNSVFGQAIGSVAPQEVIDNASGTQNIGALPADQPNLLPILPANEDLTGSYANTSTSYQHPSSISQCGQSEASKDNNNSVTSELTDSFYGAEADSFPRSSSRLIVKSVSMLSKDGFNGNHEDISRIADDHIPLSDITVKKMATILINLNCPECVDIVEQHRLDGDMFALVDNEDALRCMGLNLTADQCTKVFGKLQEFLKNGVPKFMLRNRSLVQASAQRLDDGASVDSSSTVDIGSARGLTKQASTSPAVFKPKTLFGTPSFANSGVEHKMHSRSTTTSVSSTYANTAIRPRGPLKNKIFVNRISSTSVADVPGEDAADECSSVDSELTGESWHERSSFVADSAAASPLSAMADTHVALTAVTVKEMAAIFVNLNCPKCVPIIEGNLLDGETFAVVEKESDLADLEFPLTTLQHKKVFRKIQEFVQNGVPKYLLASKETPVVTVASTALTGNVADTTPPALLSTEKPTETFAIVSPLTLPPSNSNECVPIRHQPKAIDSTSPPTQPQSLPLQTLSSAPKADRIQSVGIHLPNPTRAPLGPSRRKPAPSDSYMAPGKSRNEVPPARNSNHGPQEDDVVSLTSAVNNPPLTGDEDGSSKVRLPKQPSALPLQQQQQQQQGDLFSNANTPTRKTDRIQSPAGVIHLPSPVRAQGPSRRKQAPLDSYMAPTAASNGDSRRESLQVVQQSPIDSPALETNILVNEEEPLILGASGLSEVPMLNIEPQNGSPSEQDPIDNDIPKLLPSMDGGGVDSSSLESLVDIW